jgi:DNA-binding NtrC family response regulator
MESLKILLIEDEPSVSLGISYTLENEGYQVVSTDNGREGIRLFNQEDIDIVITDLKLPDISGIEVLKSIKKASPETGVIVITGYAEVKTAVEAMREGAYDYISKPFEPDELLIVIERFIQYKDIKKENIRLKEELEKNKQFQKIIGKSPSMLAVFETIEAVAKTDSSVIVYGESGTGKELVVNALQNLSPRKDKPYIKINCAAIPETLLETELFGYERGAFTGAFQTKIGKFEVADGGTMFFDEIGDMPFSIQAKLLRALENQSFERIGGNKTIYVDVRTICATKKNLADEVKSGRFREDLFYRINVLPINLPPLRERKEDIPLLVEHYLQKFILKTGKTGLSISPEAMGKLVSYDYPGNVRELINAVEMAVILCKDQQVEDYCLPAELRKIEAKPMYISTGNNNLPLPERVKEFEKEAIAEVLASTGTKKKKAAQKLGISRETLWRKIKEYNLGESKEDFTED